MHRRFLIPVAIAVLIAVLELPGWSQGCAMCRTALEQSAEGKAMAGSFANGILMLIVVPYAMFGTAGYVLFRAYKKKRDAEK